MLVICLKYLYGAKSCFRLPAYNLERLTPNLSCSSGLAQSLGDLKSSDDIPTASHRDPLSRKPPWLPVKTFKALRDGRKIITIGPKCMFHSLTSIDKLFLPGTHFAADNLPLRLRFTQLFFAMSLHLLQSQVPPLHAGQENLGTVSSVVII